MPVSLRNTINTMPHSVKPVFAGVSIIAAASLFFFIGLKIGLTVLKTDYVHFLQIIQDTSNPRFVTTLRISLILQTLAIFAIPPFVLAYVYDKNPFTLYLLDKKPGYSCLLLAIGMIICGIPMINMFVEYNGSLLDHILGSVN